MRRCQQQQITELLHTLGEAHVETKRLLARGDIPAAVRLLADCRDGAAQIGGFIDRLAGEGTKTAAHTEEYRDLLHRTILAVREGGAKGEDAAQRIKQLQRQLARAEAGVKDELAPDRIEVVFITWRAMQFDALESVYRAAAADPSCDAYVVPVPYYEVNADGSLGMMHYEGAEFYRAPHYHPDTETVHWQEYDIEARRPDAIFVNNPYDGNVRNACIHPDYFCERLRGLTDLLVYIPYFITGDDITEEFCTLPGCIHAHKVILESEKIRDKYIRVFGKAFGDRRGKTKEKFIALGSPKLDKVINAKREDFTLPAGFERLLRRPDGTAKKVVLYNTHMFAWLNGGEEYFKKLRSVFETFRSRDDVVLWWRPHPNTELNFRTMRPDLLGAYKALVGGYRRAGFGIYDDTQDLNRAIAHSDAYFGDGRSSLVFLYTQIGKPVFLQNGEITEALDPALRDELLHSDIVSFTFAPDGKGEWGFSVLCNALYRVRVDRAEAEYVSSVPEEENAVWLYSAPIRIGDKLLLPPAFARSWAIYDIKTGSWEKIPIPAEAMPTGIWKSAFGGAVHCDRYVLIYPGERGVFAKYDTESGAFTYYSEWYEAFQKYVKNADWGLFAGGAAIEGRIFLTSPQCNAVTELNPDDMSFKLHRAGAASNAYCGITYTKDAFWLLKFCAERDGKFKDGIVEWHPDTGESVEYADLPHTQDESRKGRGFTCAVPLGDDLYLFPWQADNIVKFNTGTKQSAVYPLDLGHDYFDRKAQEYDWAKDAAFPWVTRNVIVPYPWEKTVHTNPNLYLQLPYDYSLMELNLLDGAFGIKKWKILGTEKLLSSKDSLSPPPWHEYYGHTLDNFLNNVVLDKYSAGRLLKADKPKKDRAIGVNLGIAGQAIYDCVKESAGV